MIVITIITSIIYWILCLFVAKEIFCRVTDWIFKKADLGGPVDPYTPCALVAPGMILALSTMIALFAIFHFSGLGKILKIAPFF